MMGKDKRDHWPCFYRLARTRAGAETWMWREQVIVSRRVEEGVKGKSGRGRDGRKEARKRRKRDEHF